MTFFDRYAHIVIFCGAIVLSATTGLSQEPEKKPENPLGRFFRNLDRNVEDSAEEIRKAQQGRDQLDARPPQDQEKIRRLEQAKTFLKKENWHDAVLVLRFLIESDADSFFFDSDLNPKSLKSEVERLLIQLPTEALRNYLNQFEPIASREYQLAMNERSLERLNQTSQVYVNTIAGRKAAHHAALVLYDQGRLVDSSRAFAALARASETEFTRQQFLTMAIRSARRANADQLVSELKTEFGLQSDQADAEQPELSIAEADESLDSTQLLIQNHQTETAVRPQFLPLWTYSKIDRYLVEEQVRTLYDDLRNAGRAILTTSAIVAQENLVAYRTLSGIDVRDSATGTLKWTARITPNVEAMLTKSDEDDQPEGYFRGRVPEHHPLTNFLLRDSVSQSLSTDGKHLFSIQHQVMLTETSRGYAWQRRNTRETAEEQKHRTNEIVAYDFSTGRIRWRLGGDVLEEPFSRPLAGSYFFGPPVSDGSDLYVIGEQDNIVSLHAIDSRTGDVLWSQAIAHPTRNVLDDQVRRYWPCYPAIQDGVIVCPTTCGWLVAVDRVSRKLLWASRFSERAATPNRSRGGFVVQSTHDINRRWLSRPPAIAGRSVIVTPSEQPNEFGDQEIAAYCFDLFTGKQLWRQDKGDGLYLAGVSDNAAIFVGQSSVIARDLNQSGAQLWQLSLDKISGKPSGRGTVINNQLLLPVDGKTLLIVDLQTGKEVLSILMDSSEIELGDLNFCNDTLFSMSTFSISAFPVTDPNQEPPAPSSTNIASELIAVEFLRSNGQYAQALDAIQNLRSLSIYQQSSAEERRKLEDLEWDTMEKVVLSDSELAQETLFSMQTLAESPEEICRYLRLAADQELRSQDWKSAARHLLSMLEQAPANYMIQGEARRVLVDAWVSGHLQDIHESLSKGQREELVELIRSRQESIKGAVNLHRQARVFSFLPLGEKLELELAQKALQKKNHSEAILRSQRVTHALDLVTKTSAWLLMADAYQQQGAVNEAQACWKTVLQLPAINLLSGEESHTIARSALDKSSVDTSQLDQAPRWGDSWEAVRAAKLNQEKPIEAIRVHEGSRYSSDRHRYLLQSQQQRLRVEDKRTGEFIWSLPLRSKSGINHQDHVAVLHTGPVSYVAHRGGIQALNVSDRQVSWTYIPQVDGTNRNRLRTPAVRETPVLSKLSIFRNHYNLAAYSTPTGILMAANEFVLVVIDDELRGLDPVTGEVLWSESSVPKRVTAESVGNRIFLCHENSVSVRRAIDGSVRETDLPAQFLSNCLRLTGDSYVTLSEPENSQQPWRLAAGNLQTPGEDWFLEIDADSTLVKLDEETYGIVTPGNEVILVNLDDGSTVVVGEIPNDLENQKRLYAYRDEERLYLVVAHGEARTSYIKIPSLRASGTLFCYSMKGGLLWSLRTDELADQFETAKEKPSPENPDKKELKWGMNFIIQDIAQSPILLFISDRPEHREKIYFRRLMLVGLNKETGEQVFKWDRISNSGGFSYLNVDIREQYLDLGTYNERLKIQPIRVAKSNTAGATE